MKNLEICKAFPKGNNSAHSEQNMREAKGVKREGFNKRELTLLSHSELGSESIPCCKLTVLAGKILKQVQDDSYDNTHNEPLTPHTSPLTNVAFTMAEILLSLTIIGVVAAITLPSLTGNINERTWNTQRKALYSRMSQAISLMPAVNGYGTVREETSSGAGDAVDTASETFVTNGLSKVLQINNICDNAHFTDCGIPEQITTLGAEKIDFPKTMEELNDKMVGTLSTATQTISIKNTKAAAFETKNGESIVAYTNPHCIGNLQDMQWLGGTGTFYQRTVCANFVYDLNGKKGPNTVGKDIGVMTVMYPSDPIVIAPQPASNALPAKTHANATKGCTELDPEYRMPNMEENYSMFVNKKLLKPSNFSGNGLWSSTVQINPVNKAKVVIITRTQDGQIDDYGPGENHTLPTWCIKR